jgi:hypothetical protein
MMKMNTAGWIGVIAGIVGLLVGVGAVIITAGETGIYIGLGMLLLFGGLFFLFYQLFFKSLINNRRLQKTGIPGKARILEVKDTGVTINNNPQVKLILEVKNSFGQKYSASCKVVVSRINPGAYSTGMEVPVRIDPKNELNVALDFTNTATSTRQHSPVSAPDALKAELEKIQSENNAIALSGRPARAIIKKYTWLGAYVNGNNPYAELELEVLPENAPSFSGTAKGVIAEAAVHKYQPGQEIVVKYDLYDNSKLVIDHS